VSTTEQTTTALRYREAVERRDLDAVGELLAPEMGERAAAAGLKTTRA
jgi:hypothetical protein